MAQTVDFQKNTKPIGFGDVVKNSYSVLETYYPEIAQSLKAEGRNSGLQTFVNVWEHLSKGSTTKHVREKDPETEQRNADFLVEKRRLYKENARHKTIIDPTMESLLPAEVSNSLKSLGISTKIPIDPKNGRLIAPIEDEINVNGKMIKTYYPNTSNPKYLSNNLLSGLLMTVPPWSNGVLPTPKHITRIPEVQLLRAYIKFGKTPAFSHAIMKIMKKKNDLINPKILARRIVSRFKRKGFAFKKGLGAKIMDDPLTKKYILPSDNANLENLLSTLKAENLNDADETNWKKYGGFYKDLMLKGKLKKDVKETLAKKVQLFSKEAAEGFYVL